MWNLEVEDTENLLLKSIPKSNTKNDIIRYAKENNNNKDNIGDATTDEPIQAITSLYILRKVPRKALKSVD